MATTAKAPAKTAAAPRPATRRRKAPVGAAPAPAPAPAPAAAAPAAPEDAPQDARKAKPAKRRLVRDSFTMPADEHAAIAQIKKRALQGAHAAKKSEILRAGLRLLAALSDAELLSQLRAVPPLKTGRPKSRK